MNGFRLFVEDMMPVEIRDVSVRNSFIIKAPKEVAIVDVSGHSSYGSQDFGTVSIGLFAYQGKTFDIKSLMSPQSVERIMSAVSKKLEVLAKKETFDRHRLDFNTSMDVTITGLDPAGNLLDAFEPHLDEFARILNPALQRFGDVDKTRSSRKYHYLLPVDNAIDWRPTETIPDDFYAL
jgi:hypothetical protein